MRRPRSTPGLLITAAAFWLVAAIGSCGDRSGAADPTSTGASVDAETRTVAVVTTACGSSSAAVGSALRLDDTTVLTAAHVVAGAGAVAVVNATELPANREWPDFSPASMLDRAGAAAVVAFDPDRDLALLAFDPDPANPADGLGGVSFGHPDFATPAVGDAIEIHRAAAPAIDGTVARLTTIEADEVRGDRRVERDGFRLDAATGRGDSGAGVWSTDGRLVGLVFAASAADNTRTWAVSVREILDFLDTAEADPIRTFRCDEATSRLVPEP